MSCGAGVAPDGVGRAGVAIEERRVVTVLFADVVGFTAMTERTDPEEVKAFTDKVFAELAEVVVHFGGRVDKLIGDEVMAVFGAPTAHEDDPERAVRAALEMRLVLSRAARVLPTGRAVSLRLGVNTGEVLAGVQAETTYTVVGDAVNVASRLARAAEPDQVLVGKTTHQACRDVISFRELPPLDLKGKVKPVSAFEALSVKSLPHGRPGRGFGGTLVGRSDDLALLHAVASSTRRERRPHLVTIMGEAGVGKTRLVQEVQRDLGEADVRVYWGRCLPYGHAATFSALSDMVREACGITDADHAEQARAKLRHTLEGLAPQGAHQLWLPGYLAERLATLAAPETPQPTAPARHGRGRQVGLLEEPGGTREDLFTAARIFFEGLARDGLTILVFDDLQWAEPALLDFVEDLVARSKEVPILTLALARRDLLAKRPAWGSGVRNSVTISLENFSSQRSEDLLQALLGEEDLEPDLRRAVLDRAGGNPFFLVELLHLLAEERVIRREDGVWRSLGGVPDEHLPPTIHALITARLDALPADERLVLRDAAIVGRRFWPGLLASLHPELGRAQIDSALDRLEERDLIQRMRDSLLDPEPEYVFAHTPMRDVAYSTVPRAQRAARHAKIAAWAEEAALGGDRAEALLNFLAHHYEQAVLLSRAAGQDPHRAAISTTVGRAVKYLSRAAGRAWARDLAGEAESLYARAAALVPADQNLRRAEILASHAETLVALRRLDEAGAELDEVYRIACDAVDPGLQARALTVRGDIARMRGNHDEARDLLDCALRIWRDSGDAGGVADALRLHAMVDIFSGKLDAAADRLSEALGIYAERRDSRGAAWTLQNLAWSHVLRGDYTSARARLDEAMTLFQHVSDLLGEAWCLGTYTWIAVLDGRLREAVVMAAGLRDRAVEVGDTWGYGMCQMMLGLANARLGMHEEAEQTASEALRSFESLDDTWGQAMSMLPLAWVAYSRGDFAGAQDLAGEAVGLAFDAKDPVAQGFALAIFAWFLLEAGDLDRAEGLVRRTLEMTTTLGLASHVEAAPLAILGNIARARGDLETAREHLSR
ncbi:MAG: adenylate/guanylate cyclase domain-containing protein, partial [Actinomycetota bacterium]